MIISADWNTYEVTEGNDDAYGQTVRRRVVLEINFFEANSHTPRALQTARASDS